MAHTIASIGHVLSCFYCGLLWITMDYRLSWNMMEYRGFSWIIVDDNGLWTIMHYLGLMGHGLWTIMDYCGLTSQIVDHCGCVKYAPPWNRMDYQICTPSL